MSGIKISELNKWSISDIEGIDAKDILLPVSIKNAVGEGVTGCLRANTLVNMLRDTGSTVDDRQDEEIAELNERIVALTSAFNAFVAETNRKYNELIAMQTGIDNNQTNQLNQHANEINSINDINDQQSAQINDLQQDLQQAHQWENWGSGDSGTNP